MLASYIIHTNTHGGRHTLWCRHTIKYHAAYHIGHPDSSQWRYMISASLQLIASQWCWAPSLSMTMGVIPRDLENILVTDSSLWLKKEIKSIEKRTKNCEELGASDRVSHWIIDNSLCRLPPPCSSASPSVAQSTPPSNHKVAPSHQPCCTINHIQPCCINHCTSSCKN